MDRVGRDIFRAVHEGKWLSIEYRNRTGVVTKYWIGVKDIDPGTRSLRVEGLHLGKYTLEEYGMIYVASIQASQVIDGSYYEKNTRLIEDIRLEPDRYRFLFRYVPNLKILNYLSECNRLDATPYLCDYSLISCLDGEKFQDGALDLSREQFEEIVSRFQVAAKRQYAMRPRSANKRIKQLALNCMSIPVKEGLYVLAYRKLYLDVKNRTMRPDKEITICRENTINGTKQSIRRFLDAEDYELLDHFEQNMERIKDKITASNPQVKGVDDMPYLIAVGRDIILDLEYEYGAILNMYAEGETTVPIKAFFGELVRKPVRKKEYPIALPDRKVNLDQLLAIHHAVKYPVTYVQGPPGTGKTSTIVNTIVTAFFNERSVLFTSYNNHPIDGVFEKLSTMGYHGKKVPFPILRLGNNEKMQEALDYMREIYESAKALDVYENTLERNREDRLRRTGQLTELLKRYEEILDLKERKETIEKLLDADSHLSFQVKLQGEQLAKIGAKLAAYGEIRNEDALRLLTDDEEEFRKYLFYTSAKYIKRLGETRNEDLWKIIEMENEVERVQAFTQYLGMEENLKKLLRIFPVIATTCISAHKLGEPGVSFDLVIMDEASQCNTAVSLVPILRGQNLMLVGDPQQLNPVIVMDPKDNAVLKKNYKVAKEYDYTANSIYKTFLACDSVSDEILLSHHYRCNAKIIEFNNRKYYNGKLRIESKSREEEPLLYMDMKDSSTRQRNTAPMEAERIAEFAAANRDKDIGVITPFVNQKELINRVLAGKGLSNVSCGTVHAFQGDEKDIILFSTAITDKTGPKTYEWLRNNKELINVATSRAKDRLVILGCGKELERLHRQAGTDDFYELVQYVRSNGRSEVSRRTPSSRALGVKPYSAETEDAFLSNLNHALDNILYLNTKCSVQREVETAGVFGNAPAYKRLFRAERFDFVVYERGNDQEEKPVLAIELGGKEHAEEETVQELDRKKSDFCKEHGFDWIRIENSYARRYNYVKEILMWYFKNI